MFYVSSLHALVKCAECFNFHSKEQVTQLSICKEHNEEHNGESEDIQCTASQGGCKLGHRLIETDVLEDLKILKPTFQNGSL